MTERIHDHGRYDASCLSRTPLPASRARQRLSPEEHRRLARQRRLRRELTGWAFLAPMFIFFVVFLLAPVILVFWWSTQEGGLTTGTEFVGLDNFRRLPSQVDAPIAISNTLRFSLMSIPVTLALALGVALLLARVGRGGAAYRFLVYFPALVPGVVAGLIWIFLTNVDFGLFNTLLRSRRLRSGRLAGTEVRAAGAGGPRRLAQRRLLGHLLPRRDHRSATGALPGGRAGWRQRLAAVPRA